MKIIEDKPLKSSCSESRSSERKRGTRLLAILIMRFSIKGRSLRKNSLRGTTAETQTTAMPLTNAG